MKALVVQCSKLGAPLLIEADVSFVGGGVPSSVPERRNVFRSPMAVNQHWYQHAFVPFLCNTLLIGVPVQMRRWLVLSPHASCKSLMTLDLA